MNRVSEDSKNERLYLTALGKRYDRHIGLWLPIIWHLALRGHSAAMIELAAWFSSGGDRRAMGRIADRFSAAGLYRRALRQGDERAAQHLAMAAFNQNDLAGYRHWLRMAFKAGSAISGVEASCFEQRLPHANARKVGRLRPLQKRDELG
ncbi:MAG: hypothetical protein V4537_10700 [Pseudomonadota bacterium]